MGGESPVLAGLASIGAAMIGPGIRKQTGEKSVSTKTCARVAVVWGVALEPALSSHLQALVLFFSGTEFLGRQQLLLAALVPQ